MSCYDDPDRRVVELNRRARLMRRAAHSLLQAGDASLWHDLLEEAYAVATEAALLVAWYGAEHGQAYYHGDPDDREDPDQLYEGWAFTDGDARPPSGLRVETVPVKNGTL